MNMRPKFSITFQTATDRATVIRGEEVDKDMTIGELEVGIEKTVEFLQKLLGCEVSIDLEKSGTL